MNAITKIQWALWALVLSLITLAAYFASRQAVDSPWIHQAQQLKQNHELFLEYRAHNAGRWPARWEDLSRAQAASLKHRQAALFQDPDSAQPASWLVFDPERVAPLPEYGRIIAAAPRNGGRDPVRDQDNRLVLFELGQVLWVNEQAFHAATQAQ